MRLRLKHRSTVISIVAISLGTWAVIVGIEWHAEPIRVGILHSLSGTMAISERPVVDSTELAIREINQAGGLLGRPIEVIKLDGASKSQTFAQQAEVLIAQYGVSAIFGCWTSASRKSVRPVVERYNHLLFYPLQYEGLEQSPNIIYTGAAPNQQILPALRWALENLGRRIFLVGSDYVFPRAANAIIRDYLAAQGAEIVGEEYLLLGSAEVGEVVAQIARIRPDVVLNTINGDSNLAFFRALRAAGVTSDDIPTLSFSIGESELAAMGGSLSVGDYAAWSYFESLDSESNRGFVRRFKDRYGSDRVVSDPMEAAYVGVKLWAAAVTRAGSDAPSAVRFALADQSMLAPEGIVYVDAETQHIWKSVHIGQIRRDGQFDLVWSSRNPVRPDPFPDSRSVAEWEQLLAELQRGWGGAWANPGG